MILAANGHEVTRAEAIKYVANKKGGVHFDTRRKEDEEAFKKMDEIRDLFIGGTPRMKFGRPVMRNGRQVIEGNLRIAHAGVLSIAQDLVSSPDVKLLINKLQDWLD